MNNFKVKIPTGYLRVEEKGTESEYPGVLIIFSPDGGPSADIVACVEFESCENEIRVEVYQKNCDEPAYIICHEDGRNLM